MVDLSKVRRESMRWNLINAANKARPYVSSGEFLLDVMRSIYPDATIAEVQRELSYMEARELMTIERSPSGAWHINLTREGIDLAEYTSDCQAGIARPVKYWD